MIVGRADRPTGDAHEEPGDTGGGEAIRVDSVHCPGGVAVESGSHHGAVGKLLIQCSAQSPIIEPRPDSVAIGAQQNGGYCRIVAHGHRQLICDQHRSGVREDESSVTKLPEVRPHRGKVSFGQARIGECLVRSGIRKVEIIPLDYGVSDSEPLQPLVHRDRNRGLPDPGSSADKHSCERTVRLCHIPRRIPPTSPVGDQGSATGQPVHRPPQPREILARVASNG